MIQDAQTLALGEIVKLGSKAVMVEAVDRVQSCNGEPEDKKEEVNQTSDHVDSNYFHLKKYECEKIIVKIEDFINDQDQKVSITNTDGGGNTDPPKTDDGNEMSNDIYVEKKKTIFEAGKIEHISENKSSNKRPGGVCKVCLKQYCSGSMLIKHVKIVHTVSSNDVIPCNLCDEWFLSKSVLTEHMQFHDEIKDPSMLFCRKCNYSIKTKSVLQRKPGRGNRMMIVHMEEHAKAPSSYSCNQCGNEFKGKDTLRKHVKGFHADLIIPFDCDICNSTFKFPKSLQVHILKVHKKEFNFKCSLCEGKFVTEDTLKKHIKRHDRPRIFCEQCGKAMQTKTNLKDHVLMNHSRKEDLPIPCTWKGCGKRFLINSRLVTHSAVHTGEKPYKCEICESMFRRKSTLEKHSKLHTGERPHVCSYCGTGFIQRCNLKLHYTKCTIAVKSLEDTST